MNQTIRKKLDRLTNMLWAGGLTNPVSYIEQISYLIYLKLLDEEESRNELRQRLKAGDSRRLFPGQAERFRWSKWRFKSGTDLRNYVRDEVFPYMASLVKDQPQVAEYFRDAVLEISDPNLLKAVVDELDEFNFLKQGPDVNGDIFEYLLAHLGQSALNGQFRTPRQIRAFMVAMVDPDLGDTIYDPACGTAGFLIDAVDHIVSKYSEKPHEVPIYGEEWLEKRGQTLAEAKKQIPNLQTYRKGTGERIPDWGLLEASIYGMDVSRQMLRIAVMNLVLHGIRKAKLKRANVLSQMGGLSEDDLNRRYKVILSNPPFAGVLPKDSIRQDLPTSSKRSELLFLGLMLESLAPGGRCAVVVPEGVLFGSTGAQQDLKRRLLRENELLAVVSLPAGAFKPYSGVKTSILVFRKPKEASSKRTAATQRIWFYEVKNDGYEPDKIQAGGRPETPEKNDIPRLLETWSLYEKGRFKAPPGIEGNKVLPPGSEQPYCWWTSFEHVERNEFSLAADRYKPTVASEISEENPAELVREVLKVEGEITAGLERLIELVEVD